jgi:hypothetical protein
MRRLSLWLSMLALAGLLLGACDLRREEEAGEDGFDDHSQQGSLERTAFIVYTYLVYDEGLGYEIEHLRRADIDGKSQTDIPLPDECPNPGDIRLNPNGSVLALTCNTEGSPLALLDLDSLEFTFIAPSAWGAGYWSLDGELLAYIERRTEPDPNRLHVVRADGSDNQDYGGLPGWPAGWTPDNRIILGDVLEPCDGGEQPCVAHAEVLSPDTGERTQIQNVTELKRWSPDGKLGLGQLHSPTGTGRPFVVQVVDAETDDRQLVEFGNTHVFPVGWMADGGAFIVNTIEATGPWTQDNCSAWLISAADAADRRLIAGDVCGEVHLSRDQRRLFFIAPRGPHVELTTLNRELWMLDIPSGTRTLLIAPVRQYHVWEPPQAAISESSESSTPLLSPDHPPAPSESLAATSSPTASPTPTAIATPSSRPEIEQPSSTPFLVSQ